MWDFGIYVGSKFVKPNVSLIELGRAKNIKLARYVSNIENVVKAQLS